MRASAGRRVRSTHRMEGFHGFRTRFLMHDISLITTIAFGLTAALVFGLLAKRVGLSPIVGYLLGGLMVGPHTPGFVGNAVLASQLAEIGVILLMFGVGLHFHLKDLLAVRARSPSPARWGKARRRRSAAWAWLSRRVLISRADSFWARPSRWRARWCCCAC